MYIRIYSNTTNPEDEECFYIDVLHKGSILSRNDCKIRYEMIVKLVDPTISDAERSIENFKTYNKTSPTEVSSYLYVHTYIYIYIASIKFSNN